MRQTLPPGAPGVAAGGPLARGAITAAPAMASGLDFPCAFEITFIVYRISRVLRRPDD